MSRQFRVALALEEATIPAARAWMTGIFRFSHTRRDWVVCRQGNSTMLSWREALETKPDGILGIRLEETGIGPADTGPTPVVILNQAVDDDGFVQVSSDHEECGRRAGRHLLERYLRNFAFIGSPSLHFSFLQRRGFEDVLREAGISSPVAYAPTHLSRQPRRFRRWLLSLPRPCGLLSTHSVIGLHVSRVCHEIDLRVPDDVALITITNDDLSCLEAPVTQTSVKPNLENIGYCAAEYLDRWLRRGQASDRLVFIPPSEVTPRESTRVFALEDPLVRRALEVIHDYADPPRTVDDLIARCGKPSRRHLERAFHQSVRASPYQFMLKQRVTNAQKLLRSTEQSIERIAEAAGFSNPPQLCLHFRKLTGQSPSQYRAAERREQAARNPEA